MTETTSTNTNESEENGLVIKANQAAERLEKANQEYKALVERAEKLNIQSILGGKSEAGQAPKTPEDLYKEKANRILNRFK